MDDALQGLLGAESSSSGGPEAAAAAAAAAARLLGAPARPQTLAVGEAIAQGSCRAAGGSPGQNLQGFCRRRASAACKTLLLVGADLSFGVRWPRQPVRAGGPGLGIGLAREQRRSGADELGTLCVQWFGHEHALQTSGRGMQLLPLPMPPLVGASDPISPALVNQLAQSSLQTLSERTETILIASNHQKATLPCSLGAAWRRPLRSPRCWSTAGGCTMHGSS